MSASRLAFLLAMLASAVLSTQCGGTSSSIVPTPAAEQLAVGVREQSPSRRWGPAPRPVLQSRRRPRPSFTAMPRGTCSVSATTASRAQTLRLRRTDVPPPRLVGLSPWSCPPRRSCLAWSPWSHFPSKPVNPPTPQLLGSRRRRWRNPHHRLGCLPRCRLHAHRRHAVRGSQQWERNLHGDPLFAAGFPSLMPFAVVGRPIGR